LSGEKAGVNEYNWTGKTRIIDYTKYNFCGKCSSFFEKGWTWCNYCGCKLRTKAKNNRRNHYDKLKKEEKEIKVREKIAKC
jgi:hypothetical protein